MTLAYLCAPDAGHDPAPRHLRFGAPSAKDAAEPDGLSREEHALVQRVQSGNDDALELVFRRYYDELLHFATMLANDAASASDIVHDVFMAIVHRRETWRVTTSLRAYLFRAVRNRAHSRYRQTTREGRRLARLAQWDQDILRMGADEAVDLVEQRETLDQQSEDTAVLARAVERALTELAAPLRQIVALRWEHGLAYDDIAHILGVSAVAARKQASRALAALRARVQVLIAERKGHSAE